MSLPRLKTLFFSILTVAYALSLTAASWEALGPGAGGQIQGVYLSPNTDQRAYFFMDVEGSYQTRDGGASWANMQKNNVIYYNAELQEKPGDADTLYMGTFWGMQISRDGGASWNLANESFMQQRNIGTVATDPANPERVYAAPEWRIRTQEFQVLRKPAQSQIGPLEIFYSRDSGHTWQRSAYDSGEKWNPVYSISVDPDDTDVLWISAYQGLYRGVFNANDYTWTRILGPSESENEMQGTGDFGNKSQDGFCYGAAIAPGGYIYVTWAIDRPDTRGHDAPDAKTSERMPLSLPYVAKLTELVNSPNGGDANWTPLMRHTNKGMLYVPDVDTTWGDDYGKTAEALGRPRENDHMNYWRPKVDPRSTATTHKVLIGSMFTNGNNRGGGLYEAQFTFPEDTAASATGKWVQIYAAAGTTNSEDIDAIEFDYEYGWQNLTSRARTFAYSPVNWSERLIWVGNDQNLYEINTLTFAETYSQDSSDDEKYYHDWTPAMTTQVDTLNGHKTWINQGITSTVDYDSDGDGANYIVTVGADNMLYESFDGGASFVMSRATSSGSEPGLGHGNAVVVTGPVPQAGDKRFVIIANQRNKFGGENKYGADELWIKRIDNNDLTDLWIPFAGGQQALGGFKRKFDAAEPNYMQPDRAPSVLEMCYDTNNPNRVFVLGQYGLYVIDDVNDLYNQVRSAYDNGSTTFPAVANNVSGSWFRKLYYDPDVENPIINTIYKRVFIDANDGNSLYFAARAFVKKVTPTDTDWSSVTVSNLYTGTRSQDFVNDFYHWSHGDDDYFAIGQPAAGQTFLLAKNDSPFHTVANRALAKAVCVNDEWLDTLDSTFGDTETVSFACGGLAGHGNTVFIAYHSREFRRGIMLKGTIEPNDPKIVVWEDWHSDAPYNYPDQDFLYQGWMRRGNILTTDGQIYYYGNSQGAGTFRRPVSSSGIGADFGPPALVDAVVNSTTTATLTWSAVTAAASYDIEQRTGSDTWNTLQTGYSDGMQIDINGLTPGSTYTFRIRARKADNSTSTWAESTSITMTSGSNTGGGGGGSITPPDAVSTTALTSTSIRINWSTVEGAVEYDIQKQLEGDSWRAVQNNYTGGTTIDATGLDEGGIYKFRVKARNASGSASGWTESSALPTEDDDDDDGGDTPDIITAPTEVTVDSLTTSSARITWSVVQYAVEYDIQRQLEGDSWRAVQNNYTGGTSIDATSLNDSGTYKFRVKARNTQGRASSWTESATIILGSSNTTTAYETWSNSQGLSLGVDDNPLQDANQDGIANIIHFALDNDPLDSTDNHQKRDLSVRSIAGNEAFTFTIPVRRGITFSGNPQATGTIDSITYTISATTDLSASWDLPISDRTAEIDTPFYNTLPTLTDTNNDETPDWEYRTFSLGSPITSQSQAYIKITITQ